MDPRVSVIVPTLNRPASLRVLLESLDRQQASVPFEIIVVDNGSDGTSARDVVEDFRGRVHDIEYLRDDRRGVSYARNTGAARARAPVLAFCDDDHEVPPNWVSSIASAFDDDPTIDAIGGREFPRTLEPMPSWFTPTMSGALSLIDRGPESVRLHRGQWMCLFGGNVAIRRPAFDALRGFDPAYPRSQDRELTVRLLLSGRAAMYVPDMVVYHHFGPERLTKERFRAWSESEGRMRAGYAFEELFTRQGEMRPIPGDVPIIFGLSRFMYRRLALSAVRYVGALARRRGDIFEREINLRYLWAYCRRRWALARSGRSPAWPNRIRRVATVAATRMAGLLSDIIG
jgi:glucosyl-dolichyl phosphate glucuronosyltransferase